jgi:hypothetical protein
MKRRFITLCEVYEHVDLMREWCGDDVLEEVKGIDSDLVGLIMARARRTMTVGDIAEWFGVSRITAQGWWTGDMAMKEMRRDRLIELAESMKMFRVAGELRT